MESSKFRITLMISNRLDRKLLGDYLAKLNHIINKSVSFDNISKPTMVITDIYNAHNKYKEMLAMKFQSLPVYLPLVILLAKGYDGDPWLELGFDEVIHIPISKSELEKKIALHWEMYRLSETRSHVTFDQIKIGIYRLTGDGRIVSANPHLIRMLGHNNINDIFNKTFDEVGIKSDIDRKSLYQRAKAKNDVVGQRSVWQRKDNEIFYVRENITYLQNEASKLFYFIGTIEDITRNILLRRQKRKLLEKNRRIALEYEMMVAANKAKNAFLAEMSHELRTPLNSIIGFSQLLFEQKVGALTPQQNKFTYNILSSAKDLLELINDILDLAKVESNNMQFHYSVADLNILISNVVSSFSVEVEKKHLVLTYIIDPNVTNVNVDGQRFSQILKNFISNAIKFSLNAGTIDIRVTPFETDFLLLEVIDTGIGIKLADIKKLFVDFVQLDQTSTQGTGLGLALTKRIVEAQGGSVGVESVYGKGSRFYAILPLIFPESKIHNNFIKVDEIE